MFPNFEVFKTLTEAGKPVCVSLKIPADTETPIGVMLKTKHLSPYHALFESVQGGEKRGRYSIITLGAELRFEVRHGTPLLIGDNASAYASLLEKNQDPFDALRALVKAMDVAEESLQGLPPMAMGLFGFMTYDMIRYIEDIPNKNPDTIDIPESIFIRPETVLVFDAVSDALFIITASWPNASCHTAQLYQQAQQRIQQILDCLSYARPIAGSLLEAPELDLHFQTNIDKDTYYQMVEKGKDYIIAGDIFQVVLSQRFQSPFSLPAIALYRSLRHLNPSPYLFYMHMDGFSLVGSSPEILVKLQGDTVTVRPIAGTRKRGLTDAEDKANEQDLLSDPKELAEHLMLVDLGRNDVGRVATVGSVEVTEQMVVERYSHVMHIVSNVHGTLRPDKDAIDALMAGFPVGTVSGAPKIRAMEIIDELESQRRSFYAGCVGYFSVTGDMDTCIALRTALVKDGVLTIQSGGGIVADSTPEGEYQESCNKAKALMRAACLTPRFVTQEKS
ncbi:MAG: anthranilate synthase component I [Alphaproteobacteria bacterium]|nr:anthranilate synthase component I [Alphaproteobacteria bacterium]